MLTVFNDEYFMRQALKEAQQAFEKEEVPIGAVIVCNNTIIAKAHNLSETLVDATAHAEMQAFTAASHYLNSKNLKECILYVTLEPCAMCAGAAYWAQIGKVVYGAAEQKHNQDIGSILHPKTEVVFGVLEEECKSLLQQFFKKKRNNN